MPRIVTVVAIFAAYVGRLETEFYLDSDATRYLTTLAPLFTLPLCIVVFVPLGCFRLTRRLSLYGFLAATTILAAYACFIAYVDLVGGFVFVFVSVVQAFIGGFIAYALAGLIARDDRDEARRPRITKADATRIAGSLAPHLLVPPRWRFWARLSVGIVVLVLCVAVGLVGTIANGAWRSGINGTGISNAAVFFLGLLSSVLFFFLLNATLSLFSGSAVARLSENQPLPVLYLRTFRSDAFLFGDRVNAVMSLLFGWHDTPERDLARATRRVGPLIAIGRPGELLPPTGALRMYADDEHWVEVFKQLESVSRLVVLRIGTTEALRTELKHLVETVPPEKLILYMPRRDREELYDEFGKMAASVLPVRLPYIPHDALFLRFRPDWSAELVAPDGPSLRDRMRRWLLAGSTAPAVYHALHRIGAVASAWCEFSLRECANALVWLVVVSQFVIVLLSGLRGH